MIIPDAVTSIGNYAFNRCSGFTGLIIGSGVTEIGSSAFYGCSGIEGDLTLTESVNDIGNFAFYNCQNLNSITFLNVACDIQDSPYTLSENIIIRGYAGSTAEAYAEKYERTFEVITEGTNTNSSKPFYPSLMRSDEVCAARNFRHKITCS